MLVPQSYNSWRGKALSSSLKLEPFVDLFVSRQCINKVVYNTNFIKWTVSRDFQPFLYKKKLHQGPIRTGKNRFAKFFVFAKPFQVESFK